MFVERLFCLLISLSLLLGGSTAQAQVRAALTELSLEGELTVETEEAIRSALTEGLRDGVEQIIDRTGDEDGREGEELQLDTDLLVSATVVQLEQLYSVSIEIQSARDHSSLASVSRDCPACTWSEALDTVTRAARAATDELPGFLSVTVTPPGAVVSVDGEDRTIDAPLALSPGAHRVEARLEGHSPQSREVTIVAAEISELTLDLESISAPQQTAQPSSGRALRIAGWIIGASAIGALIPGGIWLGIDGRCPIDWAGSGPCPEVYDTWAPGLGLTIAGAALLATSVTLLIVGYRRQHQQSPTLAFIAAPTTSGAAALLRGVF